MRLPQQTIPVQRQMSVVGTWKQGVTVGVIASVKKDITGQAVCKKNGSVLFTASETICAQDNHDGCTKAKLAAVNSIVAKCRSEGGIPSQSTNPCNYGAKC